MKIDIVELTLKKVILKHVCCDFQGGFLTPEAEKIIIEERWNELSKVLRVYISGGSTDSEPISVNDFIKEILINI